MSKEAKRKKGAQRSADGEQTLSVAAHPRAGAQVRRAKGWGGIAGFALAAYLSQQAGVPPDQIALRALGAGVAGYILAWACSVMLWRHLVIAELRVRADSARARPATAAQAPTGGEPSTGAARGGASH
jgi:hypothetical protein